MKLKNKKTGEIVEATDFNIMSDYNSLAELNKDWEDYEEPTGYWYIDFDGDVLGCVEDFDKETDEKRKQIGNYFETKEEAEKAVEKLKAWKRLKDKGFRFEGIAGMGNEIYFKANEHFTHIMVDEYTADKTEKEYINDLMLLFGGEE